MTNRREFLCSGLAAAAAAGFASGGDLSPSVPAVAMPLKPAEYHKVIFDRRFPASLAFARATGHLVRDKHGLSDGDITALWFNDLDLQWRTAPSMVAGLTTQSSLFCLEELARHRGMRVAFRGEHLFTASDHIEHRIVGPANLVDRLTDLESAGNAWPRRIADLIVHAKMETGQKRVSRLHSTVLQVPDQLGVEMLVSWIIGPAKGPSLVPGESQEGMR